MSAGPVLVVVWVCMRMLWIGPKTEPRGWEISEDEKNVVIVLDFTNFLFETGKLEQGKWRFLDSNVIICLAKI